MTLKHSSRAKWARKQLTREHRDPAVCCTELEPPHTLCNSQTVSLFLCLLQTQQALSEHHNRKIQLKQKAAEQEETSSDDDG